MSTLIQRSLAGGEIAPSLYARVDTVKYGTAARTMRNMFVMRHGGAASRPGTSFIGEVKDSTKTVRLLPFVFNASQTYVLEFGNLYMRVIRAGAQVTETAQNITAITNANPCVLTYAGADNYSVGDEIYISGIVGPIGTYLNNRNFKVAAVNTGTNAITLDYMDGTDVNSTLFGAYTSGGTIAEIYTITTPYVEADLSELQIVQSADIITIVHPNYAPRELSRTGHTSWTLSSITFAPGIAGPAGGAGSVGAAGTLTFRYRVTAVEEETFEESLPGLEATHPITGITRANPAVVTYTGSDPSNGDEVYITGVVGMTEVNGLTFTVANVNAGANTFELLATNSTAYTAYSSGGTWARTFIRIDSALAGTGAAPNVLSWTAVADALEYNVYRELNGVYGFIGTAGSTTFNDTGITADTTDTPPTARNPFAATGDYPSAVGYIQQRRAFASTDNDPEKCWTSRTSQFENFSVSSPLQDDDAVTFSLVGRQVNEIRHLLDLGKFVTLTSGGEWTIEGDTAGILRPGDINPKQQSYNGVSSLSPIIIGGTALYLQARGTIVRDLAFDIQSDGYRGNDLTIFAAHMFDAYSILDWSFQQIPHSIIWAVRDDGTLLGLTYVREHQIVGWHRHDFADATVENVCCVPEGNEDAVYLVIKRTVNGATKRYIERMTTRQIDDIVDFVGMDSSLSYDGRNEAATTMTLSGGTDWIYTETLTLTASASFFTSADVGNAIHLTGSDGSLIRFTITGYTGVTIVTGRAHMTVPAALRSIATAVWSRAVDQVTGLWHLEGKTVSVFADGFVVGSPNNDSYTEYTIANGTLTLEAPYSVIHIGLPFTPDLELLDIDTPQGESITSKKKLVGKVTLHVEASRGIFVGPKPPSDDDEDPLEDLYEVKIRDAEDYNSPVELVTDKVDVNIKTEWNGNGRVFIRQVDPLPLSILAVAPDGLFPFPGGI